MTTELTVVQKQLAIFDIEEAVIQEIKSYEALAIVDTKTEKDVRAARASVRDIRYKIQTRQKELNKDLNSKKKEYKEAAETLIERLKPTEDNLDAKIKKIEADSDAKKVEKEKAEADRLAKINFKMSNLIALCSAPLGYNIESGLISGMIIDIEEFEIDDSFQELKPQAEMIKIGGIAAAKQALEARKGWEAQQAENERVRLENEAKEKELAEERARIEAEKEKEIAKKCLEEIRIKEDREKQGIAAKAKREAEAAKLAKDREEFERQKEEVNRKIQAEKEALRKQDMLYEANVKKLKQVADWSGIAADLETAWINEAYDINDSVNIILAEKKAEDEATRIEKLAADEKRAALVEADKKDLKETVSQIEDFISDIGFPIVRTDEAAEIESKFFGDIKKAVLKFEESLTELK